MDFHKHLQEIPYQIRLESSSIISTHCNLRLPGSSDSLASASRVAGIYRGPEPHHAQLIYLFINFFSKHWVLPCWPGWSRTPGLRVQQCDLGSLQPWPPGFRRFSCLSLPESGFHHGGQAGLKLLASTDLPASASESAGITAVSHQARPIFFLEAGKFIRLPADSLVWLGLHRIEGRNTAFPLKGRWILPLLFSLECDGLVLAHCNLCLPGSSDSPASASQPMDGLSLIHSANEGHKTRLPPPDFKRIFEWKGVYKKGDNEKNMYRALAVQSAPVFRCLYKDRRERHLKSFHSGGKWGKMLRIGHSSFYGPGLQVTYPWLTGHGQNWVTQLQRRPGNVGSPCA
ncbi:Protein GVQW1 [Plecturocebus cupreus]